MHLSREATSSKTSYNPILCLHKYSPGTGVSAGGISQPSSPGRLPPGHLTSPSILGPSPTNQLLLTLSLLPPLWQRKAKLQPHPGEQRWRLTGCKSTQVRWGGARGMLGRREKRGKMQCWTKVLGRASRPMVWIQPQAPVCSKGCIPVGHPQQHAAPPATLCLAGHWRDVAWQARADSEGFQRRLWDLEQALEQAQDDKRDMHEGNGRGGKGQAQESHTSVPARGASQAHPISPITLFCSAPKHPCHWHAKALAVRSLHPSYCAQTQSRPQPAEVTASPLPSVFEKEMVLAEVKPQPEVCGLCHMQNSVLIFTLPRSAEVELTFHPPPQGSLLPLPQPSRTGRGGMATPGAQPARETLNSHLLEPLLATGSGFPAQGLPACPSYCHHLSPSPLLGSQK